ncbi:uncharacterized protein Hap1MRO34_007058 isoform 2-T2 [Clarias gariepinus]
MCSVLVVFCFQSKIYIFDRMGFAVIFIILIVTVLAYAVPMGLLGHVYYAVFGGVGGFIYTTFLIFESWALFQNGDKKFTTWDACLAAGTIFVNTSYELTLPDLVPPP